MKSVKTPKTALRVIETPIIRPVKYVQITVKPAPGQTWNDAFFAAIFSHKKIKSRKAKADRKLRKAMKTKDAQVRSCAIAQAVYLYRQVARWEANSALTVKGN